MLTIEPLSQHNIQSLQKLFAQYQEFYGSTPNSERNITFLQSFISGKSGQFLLAKRGEQYVGFVGMYFSYSSVKAMPILLLNDLFVAQKMRRKGVGVFLIQSALDYAKEKEFQHIRWFTQSSNTPAQKLYKHFNSNVSKWVHYDISY